MPRTTTALSLVLAALLAVPLAGCTDPAKRPAEEAIQGAETTLAAARADATRYFPDQLKAGEASLAAAKAAQAKGDHKAALAAGQEALRQAKAVAATAAARRDELARDVAMSLAQLPQVFDLVRGQLAALQSGKKLPKGLTPAKLTAAAAELDAVAKAHDEASATAVAGDLTAAVPLARSVRERALALATSVGVELGGARPR